MRFHVSLSLVLLVGVCAAQVPPSNHVVVVVEENHSYEAVVGNSAMPFFNALAAQYGLATQYYANTHWSAPNYFMLTTGKLVTHSDVITGTVTADNIVRELLAAGKTWRSYAQSLPAPGYLGSDVPPYVTRHNPFVYFSDVNDGGAQAGNVVPLTQFASDLAASELPNYSFLIPDVQHDAHECTSSPAAPGCDDRSLLATADQWLQATLTPLLQSPVFQPGGDGLLIVVFDESAANDVQHGGGHVAAIIAGPNVVHGVQSTMLHQHQDILRLCVDALQLPAAPGLAATAGDMAEFFAGGGGAGGTPADGPPPTDQPGPNPFPAPQQGGVASGRTGIGW